MAKNSKVLSEVSHTPTPWKLTPNPKGGWNIKDVNDNTAFATANNHYANDKYNAAFIVKACNSHEALVEACKFVVSNLGKIPTEIVNKCEEAIAKAEGE